MADREKVIKELEKICEYTLRPHEFRVLNDVLALLKEQEELLRKLQKDKDKLCLEVSEWKHKYHDKFCHESGTEVEWE